MSDEQIMTLDEARKEFESGFTVWPEVGNYSIAPTGEPYVEICSGGYKPEGHPCLAVGTSEQSAVYLWLIAAEQYAKGKSGTLYWRSLPEVDSYTYYSEGIFASDAIGRTDKERNDFYRHVFWRAYSRFLISDKPVIRPAVLQAS